MPITWQESNAIAAPAATDLSLLEYHAVILDDGEIRPAVVGDRDSLLSGVLRGAPKEGDTASLQYREIVPVCIGTTDVAEGDPLTFDANSRFLPAAAGGHYCAVALEGGTVDGQIITARVEHGELPA